MTSFEEENERERKKQTHLPFILSFYSSSKFNTLTLLLHSPVKHDIHFFCTLWFVNPSVQITTLLFSLFTLFMFPSTFFLNLVYSVLTPVGFFCTLFTLWRMCWFFFLPRFLRTKEALSYPLFFTHAFFFLFDPSSDKNPCRRVFKIAKTTKNKSNQKTPRVMFCTHFYSCRTFSFYSYFYSFFCFFYFLF